MNMSRIWNVHRAGATGESAVVYQYAAVAADWERLRLRVRRNPMPVLADDERFAAMT